MSQQVETKQPLTTEPSTPVTEKTTKPLLPLIGTFIIGLMWLSGMLWLVLTTSNPVTLNKEQILRSSFVIQGKYISKLGGIDVEKSWPSQSGLTSISEGDLINLHETGFVPDKDYLIPLTITGTKYLVTPTRLPTQQPLIYPATEEALLQLEEILR